MNGVPIGTFISFLLLLGNLCIVSGQVPERIYASNHRESQRLLALSKESMANKRYAEALQILNRTIQLKSDHTEGYFNRAIVKEHTGDADGALTDYQIVLLLDSTYREAAFNRARLRYKLAQYQQAIVDFRKVLTMGSSGTQAVYFKGTPLNNEGGVAMEGITTITGIEADIYNYLGLCYQAMEENDSAVSAFSEAVALMPGEANFLVNRGLSHLSLGNRKQAIVDFKKALELEPGHAIAQFNLTHELERSGALDINSYDEIIAEHPQFTSAYVNRALHKLKSGDTMGAIEDYSAALQIDPNDPVLYVNRALAWGQAGKSKRALADYNQALKLDPENAKAYRNRGQALYHLGAYQLALEDMNYAIRLDPANSDTYFNRALIHHKIGNSELCCHDLKVARDLGVKQAFKASKAYCPDL